MIDKDLLFPITYGYEAKFYLQNIYGLLKHTYNHEKHQYDVKNIGKFYIYRIKITVDIDYRFETLYSLTYVDLWFRQMHTINYKTFDETVEEIRKTKLMFDEDSIENFLHHSIFSIVDVIIDGEPFIVKEKVDFEKEGLPMHEWNVEDGEWIIIDHDKWL